MEPGEFENAIVRVFQDMAKTSMASHTIRPTRQVRDGGFDFEGEMELLPPLDYKIPVKGEVKRWNNSVGVKEVSRLVARLRRGEFGVFVTTSYFTKACQQEVLHDGYPVELVHGLRLVKMMRGVGLVREDTLELS
tara:strand:- start:763 stop:1167 length:405 start_codon:yes stop_codon:yes gene_type:complete